MNKSIWTGFGFFSGASYPFRAIHMLWNNRNLWQYLIIPILINLIVGISAYILLLRPSLSLFNQVTSSLLVTIENYLNTLPQWLSFLIYVVSFLTVVTKALLFVLIFIVLGLVITQFGSILGAPWYGKLSEKLEIIKTNKLEIIELNIFHDIGRAILFELKKILLIIIISIPLLLLNLLPTVGNLLSLLGSLILTIVIICLDFFDAILERKRLKFRQKLKFVIQGFPSTLGFGIVCLGLITIPLFNLIIIPICVSAGTLFICNWQKNNKNISLS